MEQVTKFLSRNRLKTCSYSCDCCGLITDPQQAEQILENQQADAIGLARAMLYDPRWPWHAAATLGAKVKIAPQYLRCQPHGLKQLLILLVLIFGQIKICPFSLK